LTSKIHVVVDQSGLPVCLALTAGQASDKAAAPALLEQLPATAIVVADRGYDWQHLIDLVGRRGGQAHIPTQRDRKVQRSVDPAIYRQRNLVERFFCKLKHFRRIATRYDKLARNFLAAVALASARLWMRNYESTT
jgi:transposase